MISSFKDSDRFALEAASGGKNTIMYDKAGNPSVMVRIPKYKLSDIDSSWPSTVHPAYPSITTFWYLDTQMQSFSIPFTMNAGCTVDGQLESISESLYLGIRTITDGLPALSYIIVFFPPDAASRAKRSESLKLEIIFKPSFFIIGLI
jgi:hypothetical protein